jgi:hypothetical protein
MPSPEFGFTPEQQTPQAHPESWLPLEQLGTARPFRATYPMFDRPVDRFHQHILDCPVNGVLIEMQVPGKLRREDALKLYELGYCATGDILEFGTSRGLSTFILANAIKSSGRRARVVTMELESKYSQAARTNLAGQRCDDIVDFLVGDANGACLRFVKERRQFSLAFVDHSHAYEPMVDACHRLKQLVPAGSFVVFHDFNDKRNTRSHGIGESAGEYGVFAAIEDALDMQSFQFYGIYGACGVYRRVA